MEMDDRKMLLDIFRADGIEGEELEKIVNSFERISFQKGDYLMREGKTPDYYFFVESGFVRSFAYDASGNDISTGFFGEGQIILEPSSFFLKVPLKENFQATENSSCWKLDFVPFQEMFHSIPLFADAGRARLVSNYFALKQRSVSMITDTAKERYLKLLEDQPLIFQKASLKHIASYLGITDTSLSRIRKELVSR